MKKIRQNNFETDQDNHLKEKGIGSSRGIIAPSTDKLLGNEDNANHQRRDSAPYHKATHIEPSTGGRLGETPLLDTAETMKQTTTNEDYHESRVDFDGIQVIESVRDFPNEAAVQAFHQQSNPAHGSINAHAVQSGVTTSSIDHLNQEFTESKSSKIRDKDFIKFNQRIVKAVKEQTTQKAQLRKQRELDVQARRNSNPFGYKFFGLQDQRSRQDSFQQFYRSQEWSKILLSNSIFDKKPLARGNPKNSITNKAFEEPPEVVEVATIESAVYSRSKKEEAWHRTNQSSINMLRSFRTLDLDQKDEEYDLVGESLGSVVLAQQLNRNSQLDNPVYGRSPTRPTDYQSYKERAEVVHNLNNQLVMSARLRNFTSMGISADWGEKQ